MTQQRRPDTTVVQRGINRELANMKAAVSTLAGDEPDGRIVCINCDPAGTGAREFGVRFLAHVVIFRDPGQPGDAQENLAGRLFHRRKEGRVRFPSGADVGSQAINSTATAVASPPPMHNEARPFVPPVVSSAEINVVRMRAPEAPIG